MQIYDSICFIYIRVCIRFVHSQSTCAIFMMPSGLNSNTLRGQRYHCQLQNREPKGCLPFKSLVKWSSQLTFAKWGFQLASIVKARSNLFRHLAIFCDNFSSCPPQGVSKARYATNIHSSIVFYHGKYISSVCGRGYGNLSMHGTAIRRAAESQALHYDAKLQQTGITSLSHV